MLKKILTVILILLVIALLITASFLLYFHQAKQYDNKTHYSELITKRYSESDIAALKERVEKSYNGSEKIYTFHQFCLDFKVECLRKTPKQYYAVLLQEDGKRVFVHFNKEWKATGYSIIIADAFKSKEEFDSFLEIGMLSEEIMEFDANTLLTGVSSVSATVHYVKEGTIVLIYFRDIEKMETRLEDIRFLPNGADAVIEHSWCVSYILPIDRISNDQNKKLTLEDFRQIEKGMSYDTITAMLGEPTGKLGSGIMYPYYKLENDSCVLLKLDGNDLIFDLIIRTPDGEEHTAFQTNLDASVVQNLYDGISSDEMISVLGNRYSFVSPFENPDDPIVYYEWHLKDGTYVQAIPIDSLFQTYRFRIIRE